MKKFRLAMRAALRFGCAHWRTIIDTNMVAFTGLLVVVGALQFCTLEKTDETYRSAQRAFALVKEMKAIPTTADGKTVTWHIGANWENTGSTPTRDLRLYFQCQLGSVSVEPKFDFSAIQNSADFHRRLIGPHQSQLGGSCSQLWSGAQIAAIQKEGEVIYVAGYASYKDIYDDAHRTEFCESVNFIGDPMVGDPNIQFTASLCAAHNCADSECNAR